MTTSGMASSATIIIKTKGISLSSIVTYKSSLPGNETQQRNGSTHFNASSLKFAINRVSQRDRGAPPDLTRASISRTRRRFVLMSFTPFQ